MTATIYKATNTINGKPYIGFDSSWPNRQKEHLRQAFQPKSSSYSSIFHKAIREFGRNTFTWEVIYTSQDSRHTLNVMESRFIQEHNSHYLYGHGYNMTLGGNGSVVHSFDEIKKMGIAQKIRYQDPEQRRLTSESIKRSYTPELIEKKKQTTKDSYTPALREIRRLKFLGNNYGTKNRGRLGITFKQQNLTCPHCGKIGGCGGMKRYHFNNCKVICE